MHLDSNDKSLTIGLLWQRAKATLSEKAYFVIGLHAYPVAGGLTGPVSRGPQWWGI